MAKTAKVLLRDIKAAESAYSNALTLYGEHNQVTLRAEVKLRELRDAYAEEKNSDGVRIGKVSDVRARINSKTYPETANLDRIVDRVLHDLEH